LGVSFGTPLDDDSSGRPYASDFLKFVLRQSPDGLRTLEIGAGTGYLMRNLVDAGFEVTGLEPGRGYFVRQQFHNVEVIADTFPSLALQGQFNLIVAYGVLEHIEDPQYFLAVIREHLTPGGVLCISVPDCSDEIVAGDFSMLVHEHYSYFDAESLSNLMASAGFRGSVETSRHGRTLFASYSPSDAWSAFEASKFRSYRESFGERAIDTLTRTCARLGEYSAHGTVGIFVASRALAALDDDIIVRFFDDDVKKVGGYYPPFVCPIERRDDLVNHPVDTLVNFSRTFADTIHSSLYTLGFAGQILDAWST
jgi:SAM-dependent methyltransferase